MKAARCLKIDIDLFKTLAGIDFVPERDWCRVAVLKNKPRGEECIDFWWLSARPCRGHCVSSGKVLSRRAPCSGGCRCGNDTHHHQQNRLHHLRREPREGGEVSPEQRGSSGKSPTRVKHNMHRLMVKYKDFKEEYMLVYNSPSSDESLD
ncbi:hypothetical protein PIB30_083700 [Stylosanthes scabra]|uniref:Uncharacterized protein n=1 Tax=Stylosanthes scabra TaxID=79078 RepID=A0ABU6QUQ4_9FABA|nr:hypothetical protein [Stylosanthes scabra]